jgi:hypothetical protein
MPPNDRRPPDFLGDLGRDLPSAERDYWRGFMITPDAKVSETNLRRSFLNQFADSSALDLQFRRLGRPPQLHLRWRSPQQQRHQRPATRGQRATRLRVLRRRPGQRTPPALCLAQGKRRTGSPGNRSGTVSARRVRLTPTRGPWTSHIHPACTWADLPSHRYRPCRMDRAGITRGGQHRFSTGSGNDGKQPALTGQSRHESGPPDSRAGRPVHNVHNPRSPRSVPDTSS